MIRTIKPDLIRRLFCITVLLAAVLRGWWAVTGSNRRPSRCKRDALPTELTARCLHRPMVRLAGEDRAVPRPGADRNRPQMTATGPTSPK